MASGDKLKLECPECSQALDVTYPPSFFFNQIAASCNCGVIIKASGYSDGEAEQNLIELIDEYEPKDIIRGMW